MIIYIQTVWEQCKLGEEVDIFDGTHQTPEYTDEGVKFVSVENINTLETKKYISLTAYEQEYHKKQAEKGDVFMTRIGDVGTSKVIDTAEPLAYYVTLALLKPKEITSDFLAWLIESPEVQRNIWKRTLHIAFPKKINLGEINQIDIFLPNIDEQLKIGDFLKRLDETITLHQRKLDQLKDLKQAYLQQLFPSDGEYTPKVRFANFNRDWELCKLENISKYRNGKAHEQVENENGKYTIINSKFISTDGNVKRYTNSLIEPVFKGEITIVLSDLPNGKALAKVFPVKIDYKYTLNQRIASITPNENIDSLFLSYRLNRNSYFLKFDNGVSQTNLSKSQVESFSSLYPNYEEQKKIGNFIQNIDESITLHQHKLESLNKLKQAYLQKMFI